MICIQRPIFDTINVLSIHRKGKKHLSGMFLNIIIFRKIELSIGFNHFYVSISVSVNYDLEKGFT